MSVPGFVIETKPLPADELATIRAGHFRIEGLTFCERCHEPWPCDVIWLLDDIGRRDTEIDTLETRIASLQVALDARNDQLALAERALEAIGEVNEFQYADLKHGWNALSIGARLVGTSWYGGIKTALEAYDALRTERSGMVADDEREGGA